MSDALRDLVALHQGIRKDSPELATVIRWLTLHGAPQPEVTEEMVTYPGGSYVDVQLTFGKEPNHLKSGAYLVVHNPSVCLGELRSKGLAPGSPNEWVPYIPVGFTPAPALPQVGAQYADGSNRYLTVPGDLSPVGTRTMDARGEFVKIETAGLFFGGAWCWKKL